MGKFYNSTPWVIPQAPQEIQDFFKSHGKKIIVERNTFVCSYNALYTPCKLDSLIYVESGRLSQGYITDNVNKPHAFSLILPGRVLNYTHYMGFTNRQENIYTKRKSVLYYLDLGEFKNILKNNGLLQTLMHSYCTACIASDYDAFTCMLSCSVEKRLSYFLLALVNTYDVQCEQGWFQIPLKLSYKDISEIVYSSTKMIERIIPSWIDRGVMTMARRSIKIHESVFDVIDRGINNLGKL